MRVLRDRKQKPNNDVSIVVTTLIPRQPPPPGHFVGSAAHQLKRFSFTSTVSTLPSWWATTQLHTGMNCLSPPSQYSPSPRQTEHAGMWKKDKGRYGFSVKPPHVRVIRQSDPFGAAAIGRGLWAYCHQDHALVPFGSWLEVWLIHSCIKHRSLALVAAGVGLVSHRSIPPACCNRPFPCTQRLSAQTQESFHKTLFYKMYRAVLGTPTVPTCVKCNLQLNTNGWL